MVEEMKRNEYGGKWDSCLDLSVRRIAYSSFSGGIAALLLFRSPASRWACVAFGAGLGIGSAYTDCSNQSISEVQD